MALRSESQMHAGLTAEFSLGQGGLLDPQVFREWESAVRLSEVASDEVAGGNSLRLPSGGDGGWSMRRSVRNRGRTWLGEEFSLPPSEPNSMAIRRRQNLGSGGSGVLVWSTDGVLPGANGPASARGGCGCGGSCGGQCGKGGATKGASVYGCSKAATADTRHGASAGNPSGVRGEMDAGPPAREGFWSRLRPPAFSTASLRLMSKARVTDLVTVASRVFGPSVSLQELESLERAAELVVLGTGKQQLGYFDF